MSKDNYIGFIIIIFELACIIQALAKHGVTP